MINGDLVTGESIVCVRLHVNVFFYIFSIDAFRENVTRLIDQIVMPFNRARTPFAVTLGVRFFFDYNRLLTNFFFLN